MNHRLLLLLLVLLRGCYAAQAQSNGSPPPSDFSSGFSTTTAAIFGTLVIVFFGIALFSLCFYQRNYVNDISGIRPRTGTAPTTSNEPGQRRLQKGIDQSVLDTFPIMEYAAIKMLGTVKGPLECAVCLTEFADDESLKLLPGCCHVFHPECIDQWLENHITCPVCRADVSNPSVATEDADAISEAAATGSVTTEGVVSNHEDVSGVPSGAIHTVDRFTLRLPSHVIREIEVARRHRRSLSIAGYAYVRRGSTNDRSGRLRGFLRTFSGALRREPDAGSRSSKRVFTVNEVAETSVTSRNIGSASLSGENQDQRSPSNVSHLALLDRMELWK